MNELFIVPSKNCCPIETCNEVCTVLGHPTFLGFTIILCLTLLIGTLIILYKNNSGKK